MQNLIYICHVIVYKMKERLYQILTKKKLSPAKFASKIGVSSSSISHILSGRNKPGADFFTNVAEEFPDINLNWLFTGQGPWSNNPEEAQEPIDTPADASLFDKEFPADASSEQPESPTAASSGEKPKEQPQMPLMSFTSPSPSADKSRKVKRIILFFDDGTFECYGE